MRCFVRAGFFEKGIASVSALTAASSIPSTLQASLLFPLLIRSRCHTTRFDWSTDEKSKMKFGDVSVTNSRCCICDGETAYRGLAARQSIDVGQVCCASSFGPMSQCASHATGDMDVWFLSLCVWQSSVWCVQKVAGSWQVSLLDPESAATD